MNVPSSSPRGIDAFAGYRLPGHALAILILVFLMFPGGLRAAPQYEKVAAFSAGPLHPEAALVLHTDGTFFGTTSDGGGFGLGTIFHMDSAGVITSTLEFTGNGDTNKGATPVAKLFRHSDGNYYGTTRAGGKDNFGTIFKYVPDGNLTTIIEFTGKTGDRKGSAPMGELMEGTDGNLYGTTFAGGLDDAGTVFKVTTAGELTTLIQFTGSGVLNPGKGPVAGLTQHRDFLYGTTTTGGIKNFGTIFRVKTNGNDFVTIVNFTGTELPNRGTTPQTKLLRHTDNFFYGATQKGGINDRGTIFRINENGELATPVHFNAFEGELSNGAAPWELTLGTDGFFYGTTRDGGKDNLGTFFRVSTGGNLTTRFSFSGTDGSKPAAGVTLGSDGNFYGTTRLGGPGGTQGSGTVFKITPAGEQQTTLVSFTGDGATKGHSPNPELIADGTGKMLGTTFSGGSSGVGTIFRLTPDGTVTTLIEFTGKTGANKGSNPTAGLVKHSDGNFYGTTRTGGENDLGTVFKLTPEGVLTTLAEFTGNAGLKKGSFPADALLSAANGLYGSTEKGGAGGFGTLFRITPEGTFFTLVEFTNVSGSNRGNAPAGALIAALDGSFYGTTSLGGDTQLDEFDEPLFPNGLGTVFRLTLTNDYSVPVMFTGKEGTKPGSIPLGGVMRTSDGRMFGTASQGGANSLGTIFKLTPAGEFSTVFDFKPTGPVKGSGPNGKLVEAGDGKLYGTTSNGSGSIFSVTPSLVTLPGDVATVLEFTGSGGDFPGEEPGGPLLLFTDGHLYGTTASGGVTSGNTPAGGGQIYRLRFGPAVVTNAASAVTSTSARLNGSINPNGTVTTAKFEYGTDPALTSPTVVNGGTTTAGTTPETVSAEISGLTLGTAYYFRVTGVNAANAQVQRGAILSFTTSATTGQEDWRRLHFGTPDNTGDAADDADPDHDALVNLIEYGFGLDPTVPSSGGMPQPQINGDNLEIVFERPAGATGIVYVAEWTSDLEGGWTVVDNSGTEPQQVFSVPMGSNVKIFMRLKVVVD